MGAGLAAHGTHLVASRRTREIDYFICDDAESLAFLANLGTIPLHVWSSRVTDLAKPDWCILDLDPKGAPFDDVVTIAQGDPGASATRSRSPVLRQDEWFDGAARAVADGAAGSARTSNRGRHR